LAVFVGSLRICTRLFIKNWFGSDDVLIISAIVRTLKPLTTRRYPYHAKWLY
jgi:hypothetical protein